MIANELKSFSASGQRGLNNNNFVRVLAKAHQLGRLGRAKTTAIRCRRFLTLWRNCHTWARPELRPRRAPAWEYKTGSTGEADAAEGQRVKLDYERQCYRHAELLVRGRLTRLQDAIKAAR